MSSKYRFLSATVGAALSFVVVPVQAELFGMPNARSANPASFPQLSIEGSFNTLNDYQHIGARVNYKLGPNLVAYGDFGLSEIGDDDSSAEADGNSYGAGAYFFLSDLSSQQSVDLAVKGSYHIAPLEIGNVDTDTDVISVELLASGREPISDNGLMWYGNVGLHRIKAEATVIDQDFIGGQVITVRRKISETDTEFGFGGGVILPTSQGEFFGGLDIIDELFLGIGYRHFL